MATFTGDKCVKVAAEFESTFFGEEMFLLGVTPIGSFDRRVVEPDPMMGFDPTTMQPSRERPAILQPPVLATMEGRLPLTKGGSRPRQDAKYDVLSENYERQIVREDSAMDKLPDRG